MSAAWRVVTAFTALGCGVSGGAFLVFSTFTGTALRRLPAPSGMAAMQQLNLAAPQSAAFMATLFVPGVTGTVLLVRALLHRHEPGAALVVGGAVVYLSAAVAMTAVFHVPRNDALASLDPATQSDLWQPWLRSWLLGNHVRTVGSLVASALFAGALVRR